FEQLRWYKQSINQTITQYYDKIIELCTRIDPDVPDLLKLQYLIAGIASFLMYARKLEDTFLFTNNLYEINQTNDHHNVTTIQQLSPSSNGHSRFYNRHHKNSEKTITSIKYSIQ
ncbi:unnamed protein product, partial [Rotaria socialis]